MQSRLSDYHVTDVSDIDLRRKLRRPRFRCNLRREPQINCRFREVDRAARTARDLEIRIWTVIPPI